MVFPLIVLLDAPALSHQLIRHAPAPSARGRIAREVSPAAA